VGSIPIRLRHLLQKADYCKTIYLWSADIKSKIEAWLNRILKEEVFMPVKKTKIIVICLLILLGIIVFSYGAFFHSVDITTQAEGGSVTVSKSEPALVKEASVGGVARDESGNVKQTYTGESPKACST
jgi:hypothetical protein